MIPAHLWRLREDADPIPRPRRGPIPATGHYRAGGPVRRSLMAAVLDALRIGVRVEERVGGMWRVRGRGVSGAD